MYTLAAVCLHFLCFLLFRCVSFKNVLNSKLKGYEREYNLRAEQRGSINLVG